MTFTQYIWPTNVAARAVHRALHPTFQRLDDSRPSSVGMMKFLTNASWPEIASVCRYTSSGGAIAGYNRFWTWSQEKRDSILRLVLTELKEWTGE